MAFPISPVNGQEHRDYIYDDIAGAWKKNNDTPKEFPPDSNLIAYYPLDESVGAGGAVATYHLDGNALDLSGNGNHGTEANPVYLNNKLIDGTGTHIDLPISPTLEEALKSGDFSFSLWWEQTPTGYAWTDRISFYANGESYFRLEHGSDDTAERGYWCGISEVGSVLPSSFSNYTYLGEDYNMHHYVAIWSRTSQRLSLYIDGIEVQYNVSANILQVFTSVSNLQLIRHDAVGDIIDEVNIFDRALSQAEITELYNNPANKNLLIEEESISGVQGAIATYHLDGDVLDSSGNGNTGTPTAITYENSIAGSAAIFNGTTSTINLGSLYTSNTEIGISIWIKYSGSTVMDNQNIFRQEDGDYRFLLALQALQSTPVLALGLYHGGAYSETDTLITLSDYTNTWRHIAVSGNSNGAYLYVDGEVIDYLSGAIDIGRTAASYVGSSSGTVELYSGNTDEINLFDRALTYKEVQELYNNPANKILNNNAIDGLVGEWNLDGNSNDSSGNGRHGTDFGPNWVQGRKDSLCTSNGTSSGTYNTNIDFNSSLWTVSAWCKPEEGATLESNSVICRFAESGDSRRMFFYIEESDDNIRLYFNDNVGAEGASGVFKVDGALVYEWQSLIATFDGTTVNGYYNGNLVFSDVFTGTVMNNFSILGIGCKSDTNLENFQGLIEDVKIFNRVLTKQEILALAEQTHPVKDYSGNNNDGYSVGQLSSVQGISGKSLSASNNFYTKSSISGELYSISLWANDLDISGTTGWNVLLSPEGGNSCIAFGDFTASFPDETLTIRDDDFGYSYIKSTIPEGNNHLVFSWNGTYYDIYINSVLQVMYTYNTPRLLKLDDFQMLGWWNHDPGDLFNGLLDEVRIYDKALSQEEITALYEMKTH